MISVDVKSTLKIISKKSKVDVLARVIGGLMTYFLFISAWNWLPKLIVILLIFGPIIYSYLNTISNFFIDDEKLILEVARGIPYKTNIYEMKLDDVSEIVLKQTHASIIGDKYILFKTIDEEFDVKVNFRYYQLVQIENYLKENTEIDCVLIG